MKTKLFFSTMLFIGIVLIGVFVHFSPIMKPLPMPTGSFSIGFVNYFFKDENRIEHYSKKGEEKRGIVLNIWHPSSDVKGKTISYLDGKMPSIKKMFAEAYHLPEWISSLLLNNIKTHAYKNVPISNKNQNYPIILFSHGLLGLPTDAYSALCENLASHGYIVIGIDHPYFNAVTPYPDGTMVSSQDLENKFLKMQPHEQYQFQAEAIATYRADMNFVLNILEKLNADELSIFYKRLDLDHIGVAGHSAGGTAAIEFCRNDNRCKAVANLDGWYDHIIGYEPLRQPLLLLFGSKSTEVSEPTTEYLQRKQLSREQYFERERTIIDHRNKLCSSSNCLMVILPNVGHGDFGDGVLLKWPLRSWREPDSYAILKKINSQLLLFFDRYLKKNGYSGVVE